METNSNTSEFQVGIHSVEALIKASPLKINHIIFQKDTGNPHLFKIQKNAESAHIKVHQLPLSKLNYYYKGNHQGVIAFLNERPLDDWDKIKNDLWQSKQADRPLHLVLAAGIEDPRNFGACIRSSLGMGCDAVLFTLKGSCGLTASAAKASAGASAKIPVCGINDVGKELKSLKDLGFTVIGLEGTSKNQITQVKTDGHLVIVIGGEDKGIPPNIERECDKLYQIPINPEAHSYNASVALSILLYEINRVQSFHKIKG